MSPIPIHIAVEDELSERILRRLLLESKREYVIGSVFGRGGFGYLKTRAKNWNAAAAAGTPILLLTDLDEHQCASGLIESWLESEPHENLMFRIAVREVEAWILADGTGFADFLGINNVLLPSEPDQLTDPKQSLINLARRSRIRQLRESIVPRRGSTATQGPDYNSCLGNFVRNRWDVQTAIQGSPSLHRTWSRIVEFVPDWGS